MHVNFIAVLVAALIPMLVGFIWYHPNILGGVWMREAGVPEDKMKSANMPVIFGLSFLFSLILSMGMNTIATHDAFVYGSTYYIEKEAKANPGSDTTLLHQSREWLNTYQTTMADNDKYTSHRWTHGFAHGFLIAGMFIMLPILATNALFERKSWKYIMVNAGYWFITLMAMCVILAAWR